MTKMSELKAAWRKLDRRPVDRLSRRDLLTLQELGGEILRHKHAKFQRLITQMNNDLGVMRTKLELVKEELAARDEHAAPIQ